MTSRKSDTRQSSRQELTFASSHERVIAAVDHLYNLAKTERSRRQMTLSALDGLMALGGYWRFYSLQKKADPSWEPEPDALVTVPWWIVDNLAQAWVAYLNAPPGKTFGETLGIEGGGQGKRLAKEGWKNYRRDRLLALGVHEIRIEAAQKGEGLSLEKAYAKVAVSAGSTEDIARRAWKRHGRKLIGARKAGA